MPMMDMPTDAAAMRSHLAADPPNGHGSDPADMPMTDMQTKHKTMHGSGAEHDHPRITLNSSPKPREIRIATEAWPDEDLEFRSDGDGMTFRGYAAVFGKLSEDLGGFRERIRPGAFAKSLSLIAKQPIKMFWNHNTDIPLGTTKSGLTLTEDSKGLLAEGRLPDTTAGRDMSTLIRSGIVDSMSFGFQANRDDDTSEPGIRELIEAKLFEVSPITAWPAYPQTSASVRELAAEIDAEPDKVAEAFRVLRATDEKLSDEQFELLQELINARSARKLVRPAPVDSWRAKLEAKALATVQ